MPATPNDNVTIPGSGVLLHVLNTLGEPVPVQGDDDGNVGIAGTIVVTGVATATNQQTQIAQGESANTATWANIDVGTINPANQLPSVPIAGARCVILKNTVRRTRTVWVGRANSITASDDSVSPVWPIEPGESEQFDVSNADELFVISDGATKIAMRVENRT